MPDKMRCAELTEPGGELKITTREIPECPDEGILVQTLFCGVCYSDLYMIDDTIDAGAGHTVKYSDILGESTAGMVIGHEISGVVKAIGKEVPVTCSLRVGDTVMVYPWRGCQQCEACSAGENILCEEEQGPKTAIGYGGSSGGFGSFVPVPEWNFIVKIPKSIPPSIACMLPCSALTAYTAFTKARPTIETAVRVRGMANLLIIGTGGHGLWLIVIIKSVFCDKNVKVICADKYKSKLDAAGRIGADDVIEWSDITNVDELVESTTVSGYNKVDVAVDFVGLPRTLDIACKTLHSGGTVISTGLNGGDVTLSLYTLVSKGISIQGLQTGGFSRFRELVDLLTVQNVDQFPPQENVHLDDINSVIKRLRKGDIVGRAIINYVQQNDDNNN